MIDKQAASTIRALAEANKPEVRKKLILFASWRGHSEADAEDLVQEALAKVCDPNDSPWDPERGKSFVVHVGSIINGLASNVVKSARVRHEIIETQLAHDGSAHDEAPPPDDALEERRESARLQRMGELLRSYFEERGDTIPVQVLDWARQGKEEIDEVAAETGHPLQEIRDAQRRMKYRAKQIRAEEEEAERKRMSDARQKAEKKEQVRP